MTARFVDVAGACLPEGELPALADLRHAHGIEVALAAGLAWVRWEPGNEAVLRRLLPVPAVRLYRLCAGQWYPVRGRLPAFDVPARLDYRLLHQVLTPAPLTAMPVQRLNLLRLTLELRADHRPRSTTAVRCAPAALARWADTTSAHRLASIQAACCQGRVLLLGERLPLLAGGERYWGETILTPLGYRPEPDLPAQALREALAVGSEEILLLDQGRAEAIPRAALRPLSRASIWVAAGEGG